MTPGTGVHVLGRGHISYIVKMLYFFQKLLKFWRWFRQTQKETQLLSEIEDWLIGKLDKHVGFSTL